MGTDLFAEIARTNGAWCESHGLPNRYLSDEEINGKPLSEPELERALVIDLDRARAVAEETRWLMRRNPQWAVGKALKWAEVNVTTGVSAKPRTVVEYAMPEHKMAEAMALFAKSLGEYYAECRKRPGVTWVGD